MMNPLLPCTPGQLETLELLFVLVLNERRVKLEMREDGETEIVHMFVCLCVCVWLYL